MIKIFIISVCISIPMHVLTADQDNLTNIKEFVSVAKCPKSRIAQEEILIPSSLKQKGYNNTLILRMTAERYLERNCPGGKVSTLTLLLPPRDVKPEPTKKSVSIQFLTGGMVSINHAYYSTDQYCLSKFDSKVLTLSHCHTACVPNGPVLCIPKCCPLFQVLKFDGQNQTCVPSGNITWTPRIYSSKDDVTDIDTLPLTSDRIPKLHYWHNRYTKSAISITYRGFNFTEEDQNGNVGVVEVPPTTFRLLDNGSLMIVELEPEMTKPGECGEIILRYPMYDKFCLDGLLIEDTHFKGNEIDQIMLIPFIDEDNHTVNSIIKASVIIIGIVFLVLTVLMYLIIWPKHNIHGWTVFSFVVSMLIFFVTLAIVHITHLTDNQTILNTRWCITVAIACHFTFLSVLCWMSIMNFDFWCTFRNMSPSQERHKSVQRYIRYLCFAVGVPTLIVGISIILHFTLGQQEEYHNHHGALPGYGTTKCQLHVCSERLYLYTPMAFLLGFNLVMFSWTVFTLWRYKQKTQAASGSNKQNQSWVLFCKIFLVMGITWIFEVLSGFLNWDFIYFDVINLLQAVAIFFIFTAKRENLLWIYKRYYFSKKCIAPILRWKPCYVAELDTEQTEMTSVEKNRTLGVTFKSRISSISDN